jgi:hypothetical protein
MDAVVDSLVERIVTLPGTGRLTRDDVRDILECAAEPNARILLGLLVDDYRAAGTLPPRDWWDTLIKILTPIAQVASLILPIAEVAAML